jgi:two-component system KDP operon response regulator KdpE
MALEIMKDWAPDLIITDLMMPNMDGIELCRRVRDFSQLPIIVLSVRGQEQAKVKALDSGADDYITKPFGMSEVLARVRAQLRRVPTGEPETHAIDAGDFRIDLQAHRVSIRGADVHLTPKEFDLLVYMARKPGKVIPHRELLSAVWGSDGANQPEYLRVLVGQLRKKMEADDSAPRYLITEPWVGYRFEPEGGPSPD